ncbi:hypothetical protein EQG63_00150 [Flavobacterium amnicola]|uniref:Uncharacterized protein n=1 Tax=Flavobacterium amnicola TaxID=2506422 RepID=A0A4Q1K4I6_9FLAO|nr:hypothetical protein [Flavobacterium amnicola]RXR20380.1 hypothetical protein EQG63_00150 [Flavobacterium amnicola]
MVNKNIPFSFIFDYLISLDLKIKPMFGMWSIYVEDKIMLILRQRDKNPQSNGIWVATHKEFHQSLKKDISALTSIASEEKEWLLISEENKDFETSVRNLCNLMLNKDLRIGRIPKPKKQKK